MKFKPVFKSWLKDVINCKIVDNRNKKEFWKSGTFFLFFRLYVGGPAGLDFLFEHRSCHLSKNTGPVLLYPWLDNDYFDHFVLK
jgi:hypothetical protein